MNDFLILHRDNLLMAFDEKELIHRISGILPLTAIVTGYTVLLGFAYTYGYWSAFNIDFQIVLGIISPLDMVKSLIIPFLTAFFLTIFQILNLTNDDILTNEETERKELSLRYNRMIAILQVIGGLSFLYYSYKYLIQDLDFYGVLVYSYAISFLFFWNVNASLIKLDRFKSRRIAFLSFIIIFMPALCLSMGHFKGEPKLNGSSLIMKDNSPCSSDVSDQFILLGIYNRKGVSFSVKTKNICLFNADNQNFINYSSGNEVLPLNNSLI